MEVDFSQIQLYVSEKQKTEAGITGFELLKEVLSHPTLQPPNANYLDHLLLHPALTPNPWRESGLAVFFLATTYRLFASKEGVGMSDLCARCFYWDEDRLRRGNRCQSTFDFLDNRFPVSHAVAMIPRKVVS